MASEILKRKIDTKLLQWKEKYDKLPLIIQGMRQVGKTTSVLNFANQHYEEVVHINFFSDRDAGEIFSGALDSDTILKRISVKFKDFRLKEASTLLFLDEIQSCPQARTALKFLSEDKRFDCIASGSLLGLNYNEIYSLPVGYTETLEMLPLDFEEYLWAVGISKSIIEELKTALIEKRPVDQFIHNQMNDIFREYICIGGMPRVVSLYMKNKNYGEALSVQKGLVNDYLNDIAKYADGSSKAKTRRCFNSIPSQLAKDYKKFQYSMVEPKSTAKKYGGSLLWLSDAGLVSFCYNLSLLSKPLAGFRIEDDFKVYMADTGLLVSMLDDGTAEEILKGNLGIYKGGIFENVIAQSFKALDFPLYYFKPSQKLEIDFVVNNKGRIFPIEVKSGDNTKSKKLSTVLTNTKYDVSAGIRLSTKNIGFEERLIILPLYMIFLLKYA